MSLSDKEKHEIAEIVAMVLDSRMKQLYSEIARGFVEISNCMMEDLATIFQQRNISVQAMIEERKKKWDEENNNHPRMGFK